MGPKTARASETWQSSFSAQGEHYEKYSAYLSRDVKNSYKAMRGGTFCNKCELEVVDDGIAHREICKECNDARLAVTLRTLGLIIICGAAGLHEALHMAYPYPARQRCCVHKLRNTAVKMKA